MSNPPEPTNLTQKFAALQQLVTTQHEALMTEITALRGTGGPETTLRSINQSIWNLAGTAPGASLLKIYDEIVALRGTGGPETTLRSINQSIWTLAGPAPGAALTDLKSILQKVVDTLGDPSSISPLYITVRGLLNDIRQQWASGAGLSAYNLLDNHYLLQARLLAQFDQSVVIPTMKDLMLQIAQQQAMIAANTADPLSVVPVGICEMPLISIGTYVDPVSSTLSFPVTIATWPYPLDGWEDFATNAASPTAGIITCTDWSKYRIYVASTASTFGMVVGNSSRYQTNSWVIVEDMWSGSEAKITVDGTGINLKVYICGADAPQLGCAGASTSQYVDVAGWLDLGVYGWDMGLLSAGCYQAQFVPVQGGDWVTFGQFTTNGDKLLTGFSVTAQTDVCFSGVISNQISMFGLYNSTDGGELDTGNGLYGEASGGTFDTTGEIKTLYPGYWYVLLINQKYDGFTNVPDVTVRMRKVTAA